MFRVFTYFWPCVVTQSQTGTHFRGGATPKDIAEIEFWLTSPWIWPSHGLYSSRPERSEGDVAEIISRGQLYHH